MALRLRGKKGLVGENLEQKNDEFTMAQVKGKESPKAKRTEGDEIQDGEMHRRASIQPWTDCPIKDMGWGPPSQGFLSPATIWPLSLPDCKPR
ncbi:hypothetical protein An03g04460 [Aspergillus niger]|uniref:Uncharacterized protein n=2 Tax=Aspergillus niger TaxID=5061 RepID=A2QGT8_ASPNC|nr:hypothetical protein An03g04460 [Aspergillus niger]CAK38238.1 hypothetical protein An03g04460 [Aspergillus niger]